MHIDSILLDREEHVRLYKGRFDLDKHDWIEEGKTGSLLERWKATLPEKHKR
jgi:hypothetical protein